MYHPMWFTWIHNVCAILFYSLECGPQKCNLWNALGSYNPINFVYVSAPCLSFCWPTVCRIQLVFQYPHFEHTKKQYWCRTQRFNTANTIGQSWASSIHLSIFCKIHLNAVVPLPADWFPRSFPFRILYAFLISESWPSLSVSPNTGHRN